MNIRISILLLSTVIQFIMGFAQAPDLPDQSADSAAQYTEDLLEQQPDEDGFPEAEMTQRTEFTLSLRSRILHRIPRAAGYTDGYYSGSADKIYNRLLFKIGKHTAGGILIEKDAGERSISSFTTMNISFQDVCPLLKKLVFGDYRIESGQGLTLWSGRGYAKGADVVTPVRRKPRGIVSTLSTDEFHFFRGMGMEFSWKSLNAQIFFSTVRRSANLDDDGNILSFNESGYYRTAKELSRRKNTGERAFGGRFTFQLPSRHGHVGLTCLWKKYSRDYASLGRLRNMMGTAVDFLINLRQISLFGEFARANDRPALIGGMQLIPQKKIKIILSYRFYPLGYTPVYTLPFGEWGSGERGFYCGVTASWLKPVNLSIYLDQFEKLAGGDFLSCGKDLLVNIRFSIFPKLTMTAQCRRKEHEYSWYSNIPGMLPVRLSRLNCRQKFRLHLDYVLSSSLTLRIRLEKNNFSDGNEVKDASGFLFYQDVTLKSPKNWMFSGRVSYFSSQSRETVPYELERDLEGVLTQTMLSGEGLRFYLLGCYDAAKWLRISAKYSSLRRDDVLKIGSGHDQIPSSSDSRISVQFDFSLK